MSAKPEQPSMPNIANLLSGLMQHAKAGQSSEWWQSYHYPETVDFYQYKLISCARSALYSQAMMSGIVYEDKQSINGTLNVDNLSELVSGFDGRLIYDFSSSHDGDSLFYVFNDGAMYVTSNYGKVTLNLVTLSLSKHNIFNQYYKSCVTPSQAEPNE